MPSRNEQLAAFYSREHRALRGAVAGRVNAPDVLLEDACAFAWAQLAARDHIRLGRGGYWWLYTVAVREAWRLSAKSRRELSGGLEPTAPDRGEHQDALSDRRDRVLDARTAVNAIDERKQRLLLLQAAGYTYREIAAITGDTQRTVERQLLRAKRRIATHLTP